MVIVPHDVVMYTLTVDQYFPVGCPNSLALRNYVMVCIYSIILIAVVFVCFLLYTHAYIGKV